MMDYLLTYFCELYGGTVTLALYWWEFVESLTAFLQKVQLLLAGPSRTSKPRTIIIFIFACALLDGYTCYECEL